MNCSIVIPYRPMELRKHIFEYVMKRLRMLYPNIEIIIADSESNTFSRGIAINNGVIRATRDNILVCDADIIFDNGFIERCMELLDVSNWLIPYTNFYHMGAGSSLDILSLDADLNLAERKTILAKNYSYSCGGMLAIRKKDFIKVYGFDERLVGWGFDDNVFKHKAETILGRHSRLEANIYHIFHSADRSWDDPNTIRNKEIYEEIINITDKENLLKYLEELDERTYGNNNSDRV